MEKDSGVSPVIGESLMIVLVLILVPIVTISLMNQLPEERVPTVNILMNVSPKENPENVILYHKGGDYIRKDDISVFVRIKDHTGKYIKDSPRYRKEQLVFSSESQVFDLGESIHTPEDNFFIDLSSGSTICVSMMGKNSVIFYGEESYAG